MPNRQGGAIARYGFNGKENDNEVKIEGKQQDYEMRINDPRLRKFLSADSITTLVNRSFDSITIEKVTECQKFYNQNSLQMKNIIFKALKERLTLRGKRYFILPVIIIITGCSIPLIAASQNEALYINATGNVGIGKQSAGEKLEVNGNIKADGLYVTGYSYNPFVPIGAIIMWSGDATKLPTGWALCDGLNGTPDLRSRFIVGYDNRTVNPGGNYWDRGYNNIRYTGGEKDKTLTVNELPTHSHTGSTDFSGHHKHTWNGYRQKCVCAGQSGVKSQEKINSDPTDDATNDDGNHQHSLNINNTGYGNPFDGRPPFFTLAFIIKTK